MCCINIKRFVHIFLPLSSLFSLFFFLPVNPLTLNCFALMNILYLFLFNKLRILSRVGWIKSLVILSFSLYLYLSLMGWGGGGSI